MKMCVYLQHNILLEVHAYSGDNIEEILNYCTALRFLFLGSVLFCCSKTHVLTSFHSFLLQKSKNEFYLCCSINKTKIFSHFHIIDLLTSLVPLMEVDEYLLHKTQPSWIINTALVSSHF